MSGVLASILASKRAEIEALRASSSGSELRRWTTRDVPSALRRAPGGPLRLLAEHKRKSPSAGPLSTVLSPSERALRYAESGAAMISVLCDAPFFDGSWEHVTAIRAALEERARGTLVLAKEFVLDEIQIATARAAGADAILLIARILDRDRLAVLVSRARELGVEPFVEIVDDDELAWALDAGATMIGVNARDLDTLAMDAARAARLVAAIPTDRIAVHLSGLKNAGDVAAVSTTRADAALIGEALMRQDDPGLLLRAMIERA